MESVIPGGMYVVVTRKIVTLRQLHLEAGAQSVRLTASCEAGFDEMVVKNKDMTENLSGKSASYRRLNDMLSGFANGSDSAGRPQHHLQ